jgi:hypothetical protein
VTRGRRPRAERGSALIEVTWLSLLLMVPLVYLLMSVFDVQRGAFGVSTASRSAGRAFVLADNPDQARERARAAAEVALRDQGFDDFQLDISCLPDSSSCLTPGSVVRVVVRAQVALPLAPDAWGGGAPSFRVESVHEVPFGTYVEARR